MSIFDIVGGAREVHFECRECGKNLSSEADACPTCDGEVVEYEL